MKKILRIPLFLFLLFVTSNLFAQRYLSEIFNQVDVQTNVVYANNYSVLLGFGNPMPTDLKMDIYTPNGDVVTNRPLVIMIHTGSFGPAIFNQTPTGDRHDSAIVEMCNQFARRGYVVASVDYRLGWKADALGPSGLDIRTGTLLQAVYRAILDLKSCVRYFKKDYVTNSNSFGIDTSKIILGGMGSGGYIALAYATLRDTAQFNITKFISALTDTTYSLVAGSSYINTGVWGDLEGNGGNPAKNNPNNSTGYSSDVSFIFNMGGALGDSTWLEPGNIPMVSFHPVSDPYAPYNEGTVVVPTTGDPVVEVVGSYWVQQHAYLYHNNDCFANATFTDPYTVAANLHNDGFDGLYPFLLQGPQAGPWEWWDSTTVVGYAIVAGLGQAAGTQIHLNGLATNPDMSKTKGLAYIDTVMNYVNPRIYQCLLSVGTNDLQPSSVSCTVYPNPVSDRINISIDNNVDIASVELLDLAGRKILSEEHLSGNRVSLNRGNAARGVYLLKIVTSKGNIIKNISLQ